jgi:hypothetical protein
MAKYREEVHLIMHNLTALQHCSAAKCTTLPLLNLTSHRELESEDIERNTALQFGYRAAPRQAQPCSTAPLTSREIYHQISILRRQCAIIRGQTDR